MYTYKIEEQLLKLDNICVSFGDKKVLNGVNATIHNITRPNTAVKQGQVVSLLGPSGVGKTQLFRCISGLSKPTSGKVGLNGNEHPVKMGEVGVVAQNYVLFNHRTVEQNLRIAAKQAKLDNDTAKTQIDKLLTAFNIKDVYSQYPTQLSGGQRQRVAIAQQLLCSKYFLLMDEPFSGLDPLAKQKVCETIAQVSVQDELNTTVITTHDIHEAVAISDTIWILGRVRDENGNSQGAKIVKELNLIDRGIAWRENNRNLKEYSETVKEILDLFKTL